VVGNVVNAALSATVAFVPGRQKVFTVLVVDMLDIEVMTALLLVFDVDGGKKRL